MHDISNTDDVTRLVKTFYGSLLQIEEIKPVFAGIDFDAHMPHMVAFWEFVLLDKTGYTTNVFDKHVNLPIKEEHFAIWLKTFTDTVHSLFQGEKADLAVSRANSIAFTFQHKLKAMGKI
ncbi:MAG: group III truncated hemoglobin [Bacteroidetes bacterium]|nr:group III truncated hemoglobin [Bacteroidota bacterium]